MRIRFTSSGILASAILVGTALGVPALGQGAAPEPTFAHEPGTGQSGPASAKASNIDSGDTHSAIAPHLPAPASGGNAGPRAYLRDALHAIDMHKTGLAQQALEMAETRLLDRSTPAPMAGQPDQTPMITRVGRARSALAAGNLPAARQEIDMALTSAPSADEQGEGAR